MAEAEDMFKVGAALPPSRGGTAERPVSGGNDGETARPPRAGPLEMESYLREDGGLTELQIETILRCSLSPEEPPPLVPDPMLLQAEKRLALAKIYNYRLGERCPWTIPLIKASVRLQRDIVQEICTGWGLWAYSGPMIVVAGGYTKMAGQNGALEPTADVMMLPIREWALGAEPGKELQFAIQSRLRSSPVICQKVILDSLEYARDTLIDYWLAYTPADKAKQAEMREIVNRSPPRAPPPPPARLVCPRWQLYRKARDH